VFEGVETDTNREAPSSLTGLVVVIDWKVAGECARAETVVDSESEVEVDRISCCVYSD